MANLINGLGGAAGFGENSLPRNDDGSTAFIDVSSVFESGLNFFGTSYTGFYINNNGNITFSSGQSTYIPYAINGITAQPIIAPFFTDIDTRATNIIASAGGTSTGSNLAYYDLDPVNNTVTISWDDVGQYSGRTIPNAFQLILKDTGSGNFLIEFRYEDIQWGSTARAGYSSGNGTNFFEFSESGTSQMLNLELLSNIGQPGIYQFAVLKGVPSRPPTDILLSKSKVDELSPNNTVVGTLSTIDPDLVDTHVYSLIDNAGGRFAVSGNTVVVVDSNLLDFEQNQSHQIKLRSTDNSGLSFDKTFTIGIDDVVEPTISIVATDATAGEVNTGVTPNPGQFTIARTGITTNPLTVNYTVSGTGTNGTDYNTIPLSVTFAAGSATAIVNIDPINDNIAEGITPETVILTLANKLDYVVDSTKATATVTISDTLPVISINDATIQESRTGTANATFTVSLSYASGGAVTVNYATANGSAIEGSDYTSIPSTLLTFAPGEVSKTVTVAVKSDAITENPETLTVNLTGAAGATLASKSSGTLTITDKEPLRIIGLPQGSVGSNKGQTTISIVGEGFSPLDRFSLIDANGIAKEALKVYWVSKTEAWATFDLQGLSIGAYDVKVANGQFDNIANDIFTVTNGTTGNIRTNLSYSNIGVATVTYTNIGQTDLVAPLFRLSPTNAQVVYAAEETISPTLRQLFNLAVGTSNNGPAGILAPGKSGEFSFNYTPNGNGLIDFKVETVKADELINWASIKAEARTDYPLINDAAWDAIWTNLTAALGQTVGQFQAVMTENANYLSQLGQETSDLTRLFAFEWKQAVNTLTNVDLISATDIVDSAPGLSLSFNRTFHQSLAERYNLGSLGRGWSSQWDVRATTNAKGDVVIRTVGDFQRLFEKQTDGTFLADGGATLTITNGEYRLKEANGIASLFGNDGKLSYVEDTSGNRISLQYTNNLLTKLVHTNGDSLTVGYNAQGRLNQITNSTGQIASYNYDPTGENLLSVTTPEGTTAYTYDTGTIAAKKYSLLSVTSEQGYQRTFEYDNQGRLNKEFSNGQTQALTYSYDSTGGVTISDSTGASQQILLDDSGKAGQIRGVNNQNLVFRYDAKGNLTGATLPDGSQSAYAYDAKDNLTQQTNLLGKSVNFAYDPTFNQLASFKDPKGNGVDYSYDTKGNLSKIVYADGSSQQFTVDALGNFTRAVNRRGSEIQYTYDTSGQLTKKQLADGSSTAYGYDPKGNITSVVDGTGTIAMQYDGADRLTNVTYPTGRSLAYTYNIDGQRTKLVAQDGYTVNYSYDTVGRLKTLTDGTARSIISYDYDNVGRLTKETNGNGTYTSYEYDIQSQLTKLINYKVDNTVNSKSEYAYDTLGRRNSMTTLEGTFQYGYDATGQLTSVITPTNRTIQYQYDSAGNRTTVTDGGIGTNYSSNNLNEYTNVGNAVYTYDTDGNLTGKTQGEVTSTYTYNVENRLTKVVTPEGTWDYQYDGLGNRIATTLNGQKTEYLLDPTGLGDIVGEYNSSGLVANYTHGIGLVSRTGSGNTNYYDADALGSTVGLTATDGSYVNRYSYLPFGENLTKIEGVANPFEYVGQWGVMNEGNGLDFMRARYYDGGLGRFTTIDPINLAGGDTNFYSYTANKPLSAIDPDGEFAWILGGAAIGAVTNVLFYTISTPLSGSSYTLGGFTGSAASGAIGGGLTFAGGGVLGGIAAGVVSSAIGYGVEKSIDGGANLQDFVATTIIGGFAGLIPGDLGYKGKGAETFLSGIALWKGLGAGNIVGGGLGIGYTKFIKDPLENLLKGGTTNDPHLATLDGLGYDFQAVGEFTLVKSTTDDFEIQTRQQPWNNSTSASANSAISINSGGQKIALYANQVQKLVINGVAVTLPDGGLYAAGQNLITRQGSQYKIFTANKDLIQVNDRGSFLNINLGLADNRKSRVVGLLGNNNGISNDEFALRDGTAIGGTISNERLYGDYGNSWRVAQATSLFDYAAGTDTSTFTNLNFPQNIVTIASLTPEQRASAELIARNAGITDPTVLNDAIVDIFLTNGAPEFIQGAVEQQRINTVSAPNTTINPDGFGSEHWLTSNAIVPYTIRFSNNAAQGTTPIAKVTILTQLDTDLDLNTFSLNNFGFGNISVVVPIGAQSFSQRLDLRSTRSAFVDVNAGLDKATGVVTWTFVAIDPITGNSIDLATGGFLPPNDASGAGLGAVAYSIQPKANNANSTRIDAQSSITFNNQAPIQTTPIFNLLDSDIPTSKVNILAATNNGSELAVSWTGADSGSGIATYDVYVSTDGGTYTLWQNKTALTTATYTGEIGKTYSFYSIATDNVGRTEVKTATAETTTKLLDSTPTITLAITDADLAETLTGQPANPGQFTLTRTGATTADLVVNYTIAGTATSGTDYQTLTSTVTFKAGNNTAVVDINTIDDNIFEGNETVILTLADGGTNYKLADLKAGTLTISDNEAKPTISVANLSQLEGNSGNTNYGFNLTLSNPSIETITVKYTTADDTATAGSDYIAATETVTFNPGETTKAVNIVATGDTLFEADETFKLNLTDAVNATITTASATGTIVNDDVVIVSPVDVIVPPVDVIVPPVDVIVPPVDVIVPPVETKPVICISDAHPKFGKEGDPEAAHREFNIYLSHASAETITVEYSTVDGTAIGDEDFEPIAPTTLTFAPGEICKTISVTIFDDDIHERKENFTVELSNPTHATIELGYDYGIAEILDDDLPGISIDATDNECAEIKTGKSNSGKFTFKRTGSTTDALNVKYTIEGTATNGTDYTKVADTIEFAAGSDTSTIEINPIYDGISEGTESITIKLSDSDNYTVVGDKSETANITDLVLPLVLPVKNIDKLVAGLQGTSDGEVIDLRSFAGQTLKVDTVSVGDAAYQNYIGFYAVEDAQGTLANGLKVGDAGYAEAAIKSAIMRSSKIETQSDLTVTGGKIFAPVVIANGTFEDFLNRNPQNQANSNIHAYFNYIGANTDGVDHFRLLGDNKFGVEDLYGGGDRDYNDIVVQLTVKS